MLGLIKMNLPNIPDLRERINGFNLGHKAQRFVSGVEILTDLALSSLNEPIRMKIAQTAFYIAEIGLLMSEPDHMITERIRKYSDNRNYTPTPGGVIFYPNDRRRL